jgi:hypothetical protein
MRVVLLARKRKATRQRFATGRTDDITDDENVERGGYLRAEAFAFRCFTK